MGRTCYVCGTTYNLHIAPKVPERLLQWMEALGVEAEVLVDKNFSICNLHFDKSFISAAGRLMQTAVPCLPKDEILLEKKEILHQISDEYSTIELYAPVMEIYNPISYDSNDTIDDDPHESENNENPLLLKSLVRKEQIYKQKLKKVRSKIRMQHKRATRLDKKVAKLQSFLDELVDKGFISKMVSES